MYNLSNKNVDEWVRSVRIAEQLMRGEIRARRHRYFTLERQLKELRKTLLT